MRLVIDGTCVRKPELPRVLLMGEIHAYSYREHGTGKSIAVYWTVAYDGGSGDAVDVIEGHYAPALDEWRSQFTPEERNRVKAFCSDMREPFLAAAKKWLPLAIRAVDRFHVAKDGVAHLDRARRRIQKGAGNGAAIKRWHRKLVVNRGKRRREHAGEVFAENEKPVICNLLCICDSKHSHLHQAYLALQPCYIWQDKAWSDQGFGGFAETRKRILIAFGKPGAVESATHKALRIKQAAERKADGKKARGRKGKRC